MLKSTIPGHKQSICGLALDQRLSCGLLKHISNKFDTVMTVFITYMHLAGFGS